MVETQEDGDADAGRIFSRLSTDEQEDNCQSKSLKMFRTSLERVLVVVCLILFVICVIMIALLVVEKNKGSRNVGDRKINDGKGQGTQACQYSAEAKRVGLLEFLNKVQSVYHEYSREKVDVSSLSNGQDSLAHFKNRYLPLNVTPAYLKAKTDAALSLYDEMKTKIMDEDRMKPREVKAVHQVKLFLKTGFGVPYDHNFYNGDWLMGPNQFCWQPICEIGDDISNYAASAKPDNLTELQEVIRIIRLHGETVKQYQSNMRLGVKVGMVRSKVVCLAALDAVRQYFKIIAKQNDPRDILKEKFVEHFRNESFIEDISKVERQSWFSSKGKNISQSIDEALIEGIGKPLVDFLNYLENEHLSHCLPMDLSSGLAGLPVDYIYKDGNKTHERTTKTLPITGQILNGKDIYTSILPYFTTNDITPEEINRIGEERLKVYYAEAVEVARNVTRKSDTKTAIREFREMLNNTQQFHNDEPFPANESDSAAHKNCSDEESAKKNCPTRWAAMLKWSKSCRELMARLSPKLIPLFYHTGERITVPNCPIEMIPDFNPSSGAQSFSRSDSSCSKPTYFKIPFFLNNFGPKFGDLSVTAHEGWPGHHTQVQGRIEYFQDKCSDVLKMLDLKTSYTFFVEGWALYAENPLIAEDTDTYKDEPMEKYGMLQWQIWRALRLIVDTGLHHRGMNRTTALRLFAEYAWEESDVAEKEVTRYQSVPGQATSYMLGQEKIWMLRKYCEKELDDEFDMQEFHYQVLSQGSAPEAYLDKHIRKFVNCTLGTLDDETCEIILNPQPTRVRSSAWETDLVRSPRASEYYFL